MGADNFARFGSLKLFLHQIYEYRKGVRSLVLCTTCPACAALLRERLDGQGIGWLEQPVGQGKVNLYFGHEACLRVVATFAHKPLHRLSAEEDFILGAMLGYDIRQQCERYCRRLPLRADATA